MVDEDRRFYLETLREDSRRYGLRILGYSLMTNHVHLTDTTPLYPATSSNPPHKEELTVEYGYTVVYETLEAIESGDGQ